MIVHRARAHNAPGRRALPLAALVVLAVLAGCGDRQQREAGGTGDTTGGAEHSCPVTVDASGWRAYADLAGRVTAGKPVDHAELAALGEQPAFAAWRASLAPNVLPPLRIGNWLEETFRAELGIAGDTKTNADRRDFAQSYGWSWDRRAAVDSLVGIYEQEALGCAIRELAAMWIAPARLPSQLTVYFLPTKPEIRWHEGRVFVDTGVLVAGGTAQLNRQAAGLVYRNLGAEDGINPLEAAGGDAVAHSLRVLRNEGVAAWIEDLPHTYFRPDHYRLRKVAPVPERFFAATQRTVELLNSALPPLLADPARLEAEGNAIARRIAAGGGFGEAGYGMAAVIAGRLGEDRLRAAARTVPAFLAAYQEAALLNGEDRPLPGAVGHELYESVPPLAADAYAGLLTLLEARFGTGS